MNHSHSGDNVADGPGAARGSLIFIALILAAHFLLLLFAGSIPSHRSLFLFFFAVLVMLPGYISVTILFPRARVYFKLFLSLLLGSAHFFVFLIIFALFDLDIFYISMIIPISAAALSLYRSYGSFVGFDIPEGQPLSRPVLIIMTAIFILISVLTLVVGDPVLYTADSPDNIAYIRTVSRSHEVFPSQFIYKDGGMLTRDIRRGLLHAMWGTVNTATSRVDVFEVWPFLPWIGSIFVLLGIFCLGVQLFRSQAIGISAVILYLLFYQGGLAGHQLIINAYSFFFAKAYLFAFFTFVPLYLSTHRREFLFMAVVSSFAAVSSHVSYIMIMPFIAFFFSAVEWFGASSESRKSLLARTLPALFGCIVLANLPYLLLRYLRDYNPANEIHTHVQGMLFLTDRLAIVNPILFFQRTGYLMGAAIFAVFILWKISRDDRNLRSMLTLVAAVYLLAFNPLWVPFIMDKITYLIIRFSVAAPSMIVVAYLIRILWLKSTGKIDHPSRWTAAFGWLLALLFLVPGLISNFSGFAYGGRSRDIKESRSCLALNDLYSAINRNIPEGSVIASDPLTSYGILAFTDQYVVCTFDQHSTPNDSTAVERIIACRDMYLPGSSCAEIISALERYEAGYIVMNGRIPAKVRSQYWRPDERFAESNARKLLRCGDSFKMIYSGESLYLLERSGTAAGDSEGVAGATGAERQFVLEEFRGDYGQLTESGSEGIYIRSWGQESGRVARGDTVRLYVDWVTSGIDEPGSYIIYVRFDTGFEKGILYRERYGKIYRKILEKINGETYRFRNDVLPFEGIYPPDKWARNSVIRQYIDVPVPRYIAGGSYTISIKMDNAPHYSNLVLRDLLRDDDFYDGPDLMTVEIE